MKYAFASPEWLACLHGIIAERAANLAASEPGFSYSICEVFTGAPAHLTSADSSDIAWHAVIRGAEVAFGTIEIDDADFKARGDYSAIAPVARYDTRGEPARATELAAMVEALRAQGKLQTLGASPAAGQFSVHDAIARVTA